MKAHTNNNLNLSRRMIPYTPEECYRAYLALYGLRDLFRRPAALSAAGGHIMQRYAEAWPVIGITPEAAELILAGGIENKGGNYRLKTVPKVQRAHLKDRVDTWVELMQFEHTLEQFWQAYTEADKTVLCLPTQNAGISRAKYVPVPEGLFVPHGYRARISHPEIEWLMAVQSETVGGMECAS
jgi:hypothetical protein